MCMYGTRINLDNANIYICGEVATKRSNILESPFTMLTWRMEDILGTVNKLYDQIVGQ